MLALSKVDQDSPSTQNITISRITAGENSFNDIGTGTIFGGSQSDDILDQLIDAWRRLKDRRAIDFSYRVHLRYHILQLDHARKRILIGHGREDVLCKATTSLANVSSWQTTYAGPMIEATHLRPLGPRLSDILSIEPNLMQQRRCLEDVLDNDQGCFTMNASQILTSNHVWTSTIPETHRISEESATDLRITFNAHDLREARYLHDQLCVLGPIIFALTANNPGWSSRTASIREELTHHSEMSVDQQKSDPSECVGPTSPSPIYLTADAPGASTSRQGVDQRVFWRLKREGFDDTLATLFARNTLSTPCLAQMNQSTIRPSEHHQWLDCLAGLNPYARLQPPLLDQPQSGFRVEFSGINTQLTDFAHAACISFVALLRFAILGFDLDLRLPPEKAVDNMKRSQTKDAVIGQKFWWRMPRWSVKDLHPFNNDQHITTDRDPTLVSIDHIVNGDPSRPETIGLSGVVEAYLADTEDDGETRSFTEQFSTIRCNNADLSPIPSYLAFVRTRAKGTTWTDARWIDTFVNGHRACTRTGEVSPEVLYDLFVFIKNFNRGGRKT